MYFEWLEKLKAWFRNKREKNKVEKNKNSTKVLEPLEKTEADFFSGKVQSAGKIILKRFFKHKLAVVGMVILSIIILAALFAPLICAYSPTEINLALVPDGMPVGPGNGHIFGVDQLGRDYFARALYGARVSLSVGLVAMLISFAIGLPLGMAAGFYGGLTDNVICRIIEFLMCLPLFFLIISISAVIQSKGILPVMIVIGAFGWMGCARVIRGQILQVKNLEYAKAAKALGLSDFSIMFRHLLPNAIMPLIVTAIMSVVGGIMTESGLSFLGLGVQAPLPSWGSMINDARRFQLTRPFMIIIPGMLIFLVVLSLNFIGDGLRDAIDPKNSK